MINCSFTYYYTSADGLPLCQALKLSERLFSMKHQRQFIKIRKTATHNVGDDDVSSLAFVHLLLNKSFLSDE